MAWALAKPNVPAPDDGEGGGTKGGGGGKGSASAGLTDVGLGLTTSPPLPPEQLTNKSVERFAIKAKFFIWRR